MAITDYRINEFSKNVTDMPDNPTQAGFTAKDIKEWFDSNSNNELKNAVNGIVDHIENREAEEDINFSKKADRKNVIEKDSKEAYTPTEDTHPANKGYVDNALEAFADYDEERVDLLLMNKADKTNVIEKNCTTAFTPTASTHPANKGYVDNAINEKISQLGAGDMAKAVYDPQGKNKDIFAEMNKYLPLAGGTLNGELWFDNAYGHITASNRYFTLSTYTTNDKDPKNKRYLQLNNQNHAEKLQTCFKLFCDDNGVETVYNIFGEHNRPKGSYTGNGDATTRRINVGGFNTGVQDLLYINSQSHCCLVGYFGAVVFNTLEGTTVFVPGDKVEFNMGVLTLSTTNIWLNNDGWTYYYRVL